MDRIMPSQYPKPDLDQVQHAIAEALGRLSELSDINRIKIRCALLDMTHDGDPWVRKLSIDAPKWFGIPTINTELERITTNC